MSKKSGHIILVLLTFILVSCGYIKNQKSEKNIARVNDSYLTKEDVNEVLPKNISKGDSVIFVHQYINRWATKNLLFEGAKRNLPQSKQNEFEEMVKEYRQELYTESYKDLIIANRMDTVVTEEQMQVYFDKHKENFKLHENLAKLRYVKLPKDYIDIDKIKEEFKRFNEEDQDDLNNEVLKFKSYFLDDSIWVEAANISERIAPLRDEDMQNYLKKDNYIERSDSLSLYLIFIKDVRLKNQQAPLMYIKPLLKQIIRNKRKLKFAKEFEKDITKDGLENNKFEIYH